MRRKIKSLACILLMVIFAVTCICMPVFAYTKSSNNVKTVKVGLVESPGYVYEDSKGVWRGIDVEYTENIAQQAGFKVKIVPIDPSDNVISYLSTGKVDMLGDLIRTTERANKYYYSEYEQGNVSCSVIVKNNNNKYDYGDIGELSNMKIGTFTSAVRKIFDKWRNEHGLKCSEKSYSNLSDSLKALNSGDVDGVVIGAEYMKGYKTIFRFSPTSYYYAFNRNNLALKNQVDEAMAGILEQNPYYESDLRNKYLMQSSETQISFTKAEQKYIADHSTIKVAVLDDDEPYYSKTINGKNKGILPDYYSKLASATGLKFKYVCYSSHKNAIKAVVSGKADIIGMYSDGLISAHNDGLSVTNDYASVGTVMITRSGTDTRDIKTIAVKSRSLEAVKNSANEYAANAKLKGYDNATKCFDALKKKKVDAIITGLPTSTWLMNQTTSSAYSVSQMQSLSLDLCGAVAYDNLALDSIINKGIYNCSYSFEGIVTNDTMQESGLKTFIGRIPAVWIAVFAILMIVLVLALIFMILMLRRRQKEKEEVDAKKAETDHKEIELAAIEKNAEEKNEFFSTISHDMRTPLNAIIGFSDLAAKHETSPEIRTYLNKIQTSGLLLHDMIDDTLTLSKIGSSKFEQHLEPVRDVDIIESVMDAVRTDADKRNIELVFDDSKYVERYIYADKLNQQKILLNLLTNAVKYTPEGGKVEISIDNKSGDSNSHDTIVSIKDNGIGIDKEFLPHLYEPFAQEKRAGYEASGTGLGLAIVKQLVELSGGTIDVQSEKNKGTTFTIKMHFYEAADASNTESHEMDNVDIKQLAGKIVLLCEDNMLNQEIAKAVLEEKGMHLEIANNGEEGVRMFEKSAEGYYDVIFMDIRMPVMNGYEATRAIRELDREDSKTIPIVAITANAFDDDIKKSKEAGMNAHLSKPIEPDAMFQTLMKLIV